MPHSGEVDSQLIAVHHHRNKYHWYRLCSLLVVAYYNANGAVHTGRTPLKFNTISQFVYLLRILH